MATVINTPAAQTSNDETMGIGVVLGITVAVILAVLFFAYALPAIMNGLQAPANTQPGINVEGTIPLPGDSGNNPGTSPAPAN